MKKKFIFFILTHLVMMSTTIAMDSSMEEINAGEIEDTEERENKPFKALNLNEGLKRALEQGDPEAMEILKEWSRNRWLFLSEYSDENKLFLAKIFEANNMPIEATRLLFNTNRFNILFVQNKSLFPSSSAEEKASKEPESSDLQKERAYFKEVFRQAGEKWEEQLSKENARERGENIEQFLNYFKNISCAPGESEEEAPLFKNFNQLCAFFKLLPEKVKKILLDYPLKKNWFFKNSTSLESLKHVKLFSFFGGDALSILHELEKQWNEEYKPLSFKDLRNYFKKSKEITDMVAYFYSYAFCIKNENEQPDDMEVNFHFDQPTIMLFFKYLLIMQGCYKKDLFTQRQEDLLYTLGGVLQHFNPSARREIVAHLEKNGLSWEDFFQPFEDEEKQDINHMSNRLREFLDNWITNGVEPTIRKNAMGNFKDDIDPKTKDLFLNAFMKDYHDFLTQNKLGDALGQDGRELENLYLEQKKDLYLKVNRTITFINALPLEKKHDIQKRIITLWDPLFSLLWNAVDSKSFQKFFLKLNDQERAKLVSRIYEKKEEERASMSKNMFHFYEGFVDNLLHFLVFPNSSDSSAHKKGVDLIINTPCFEVLAMFLGLTEPSEMIKTYIKGQPLHNKWKNFVAEVDELLKKFVNNNHKIVRCAPENIQLFLDIVRQRGEDMLGKKFDDPEGRFAKKILNHVKNDEDNLKRDSLVEKETAQNVQHLVKRIFLKLERGISENAKKSLDHQMVIENVAEEALGSFPHMVSRDSGEESPPYEEPKPLIGKRKPQMLPEALKQSLLQIEENEIENERALKAFFGEAINSSKILKKDAAMNTMNETQKQERATQTDEYMMEKEIEANLVSLENHHKEGEVVPHDQGRGDILLAFNQGAVPLEAPAQVLPSHHQEDSEGSAEEKEEDQEKQKKTYSQDEQ